MDKEKPGSFGRDSRFTIEDRYQFGSHPMKTGRLSRFWNWMADRLSGAPQKEDSIPEENA